MVISRSLQQTLEAGGIKAKVQVDRQLHGLPFLHNKGEELTSPLKKLMPYVTIVYIICFLNMIAQSNTYVTISLMYYS